MANIPQNDQYSSQSGANFPSGSFVPKFQDSYRNLARIRESGGIFNPTPTPMPGTPEDYQARQAGIFQYGTLVNNSQGIPTQTQFLPPDGNPRTPIPLPSDYGTFADPMSFTNNGQNLSWGTPVNPVIRNLSGDTPGQYVQDLANPDMLVKTNRGSNPIADISMRAGRLGSMYQVDHIIPLALGGADTLANRQLLTYEQNDKKTRAQAIPYTLYAYGDISLDQARAMAMQWKDRDLSDVPQPNDIGLIDIEIARETSKRWTQPKPITLKDVVAAVPDAAKDLGKGFLPDPIREFVKGVASGLTMNFIPYEQGENQGVGSKIAGIGGMIVGTLAPWSLAAKVLAAPFAIARGASVALGSKKAMAVAEAASNGFGTAEKIASGIKTLNRNPGYVGKFLSNPELIQQAGKFGATSALFGQGSHFVAEKFNPYTLSGEAPEQEQKNMMGNIFRDLSIGAVTGVASPTLKGTAYSVVTPMALSFWADPDDPVNALTQGVMFGVMHGAATYKRPGYNDVEAFGGKPYENPVTKSYNHVMDHAAYESLGHYNRDVMPEISLKDPVPKLTPEKIQELKNNAINNVWKQFFFQKEGTSGVQKTTLNRFKEFSRGIDEKLDNQPAPTKIPLFSKLSPAARREANAQNKAQKADLQTEFGPEYTNKVPDKMPALPETGMDLQSALTEIKRITIAARQLYKGTLSGEMRNQADLDDLLSFGKMIKDKNKLNLQNRFESQIRFAGSDDLVINSPKARQAAENMMKTDPKFMTESTRRDTAEPSGKYPVGDIAATGAAVSRANVKKAEYFFEQKELGNASPNVLLVKRPDLAPLFSMHNRLLTPEQIKAGEYAIDANPANAIQVFGIVKNPEKGGAIELVELGMVASNHRLNLATGKDHTAFNQHPLVKKWEATGGAEGMRPLTPDNHKDTIANAMDRNKIEVLVANLGKDATKATIESNNPFIPLEVNDANWLRSIQLQNLNKTQPTQNTLSTDIARVNSALGAKDLAEKIQDMKMNPDRVKPASEYIPHQVTEVNPNVDRAFVPQETTRTVLQTVERSIDVASPAALKAEFKKNFNIVLTDEQAALVYSRRNEMTMKDGIKMLVDAANAGQTDAKTRVALEFVKTYVNSGAIAASPTGIATLELPLLGKSARPRGVEEHVQVAEPEITPNASRLTDRGIEVAPESTPAPTTAPQNNSLLDRVMTAAKQMPTRGSSSNNFIKSKATDDLSLNYVAEGKSAIESAVPPGRRYTAGDDTMADAATQRYASAHQDTIRGMEDRIQADLQGKNMPQPLIDAVKAQVRSEMENHSTFILNNKKPGVADDFIDKPKFIAREFYDSIDKGIKADDNPAAQYFYKALDKALKDTVGPDYRKNPKLPKALADYFRNVFFSETNIAGKAIEQPKEVVEARAKSSISDRGAESRAFNERNKQLTENKSEGENTLTDRDMAELGLEQGADGEPSSGFFGMQVRPLHQEADMVKDLTKGEDLMSALFAEGVPTGGAQAVRAVNKLFLGSNKAGDNGLVQFLTTQLGTKRRYMNLKDLEDEALKADAKFKEKTAEEAKLTEEASQMLPVLKQELESINKAISDPLERASWQTDDVLYSNLEEITKQMAKFSKILEGSKPKDGGGGPGVKDGKGGIGDMFGSLWNVVKKPFKASTVTYAAPTTPEPIQGPVAPVEPQKPASYSIRGLNITDDDLEEASRILFSEVSNRDPEKQKFEVRHIVNTAINRANYNPKQYGDTFINVLQKPSQYQGYAPEGVIQKDGSVKRSQYQMIRDGDLDEPSRKKLEVIKQALEELKSGKYDDTTNGSRYYVHASDGSLWLGATIDEAKKNANDYEMSSGINVTNWGGIAGMPASLARRN